MTTATKTAFDIDRARDERDVHQYMESFFKRYAPADKREAAEFHADLIMVVQAVHRDASRETHALLMRAVRAMPNPLAVLHKVAPIQNPQSDLTRAGVLREASCERIEPKE